MYYNGYVQSVQRVTLILTLYSTDFSVGHSLILRANQALISAI